MRRLAAAVLAVLLAAPAAAVDLSPDAVLRDHLWKQLAAKPRKARPTVGLVLSAGSLRATTHVGVLSVLENAGFPIDVVSGTSMGAIIGSLYSGGKPIKDLVTLAVGMRPSAGSNLNAFSLLRLVVSDKLLSSEKTQLYIDQALGGKRFEDLPKPFACVAMDLYSGEPIIFREGPLALAVRASMNLPGIFEPVEYRHRYLVDGGVVDYIPVDAARLLGADWVLASIAESDYTRSKPRNVLESLEQVIDIRGSLLAREQKAQANFLVEPPVGDIGLAETERAEEAISKGVVTAYQRLPAAMESYILFAIDGFVRDQLPEARKP
jgi:NTE family protein